MVKTAGHSVREGILSRWANLEGKGWRSTFLGEVVHAKNPSQLKGLMEIKELIDWNQARFDGNTWYPTLVWAVRQGVSAAFLESLLQAPGIDLGAVHTDHFTPFIAAISTGNEPLARVLLDHYLRNGRNKEGEPVQNIDIEGNARAGWSMHVALKRRKGHLGGSRLSDQFLMDLIDALINQFDDNYERDSIFFKTDDKGHNLLDLAVQKDAPLVVTRKLFNFYKMVAYLDQDGAYSLYDLDDCEARRCFDVMEFCQTQEQRNRIYREALDNWISICEKVSRRTIVRSQ